MIILLFKDELIARTLRDWMKIVKDPTKVTMLSVFGMLVQRRSAKTTCGLFDFDWPLLYGIIAAASTNFIILMQFDLASRRNN